MKMSETKSALPLRMSMLLATLWAFLSVGSTADVAADSKALAGVQTGPVPWAAEIGQLRSRLQAIGFPALPREGTAFHIHQHLDIRINGTAVTVPGGIGINETAAFISPVHTHDESGIIHIESNEVRAFTLGQFFDVWGVRFTKECIGGYCSKGPNALMVFSNGSPVTSDPRLLNLASRHQIAVIYGPSKAIATVPSSYEFPQGF